MEHYSELYSIENSISDSVLTVVECLPVMEELDALPTVEELSKGIDSLRNGKAAGLDGIPPEAIRYTKSVLLNHLHKLLCQC